MSAESEFTCPECGHTWETSDYAGCPKCREDIAILEEAMRLIQSRECKRHTWITWDVFAGRNVENEETTQSWTLRALREARRRVLKQATVEPKP